MTRHISTRLDTWPLKKPFVIARGSRTETQTVTVNISEGNLVGSGEAVPSPRYDETIASVIAQIAEIQDALADGMDRGTLQKEMSAGAARNAVDAALWDLEAKQTGRDAGILTTLGWPTDIQTVQTISILSPEEMGNEAASLARFPAIKVKLNTDVILDRIRAVHTNAPDAKLLVDANESWTIEILEKVAPQLAQLGVVMIEQPLRAGQDNILADYSAPLPIYADESCHTRDDLPFLAGKYQGINIKLDKTGGLTEALALLDAAQTNGFEVMVGCMLGTSLGIAPAMFVASRAKYVDIDPPALLAKDRKYALKIKHGTVSPLDQHLWGGTGCDRSTSTDHS